jgi:hypothetical protein
MILTSKGKLQTNLTTPWWVWSCLAVLAVLAITVVVVPIPEERCSKSLLLCSIGLLAAAVTFGWIITVGNLRVGHALPPLLGVAALATGLASIRAVGLEGGQSVLNRASRVVKETISPSYQPIEPSSYGHQGVIIHSFDDMPAEQRTKRSITHGRY